MTHKLDEDHWTTDYIPISYNEILSNSQLKKSLTFVWSKDYHLFAICRGYYLSKKLIEIGDVWLSPDKRGKEIDGEKISVVFLRRVLDKIWKKYPDVTQIKLLVDKNNMAAIKLYYKCGFEIEKSVNNSKLLSNEPGYSMIINKVKKNTVKMVRKER